MKLLMCLPRLVHETDVSYEGEHFSFENLTILPRPVRENSLPIWTSAYWNGKVVEGPLRRAGRFGDGFIYRAPPRLYKECKDKISDYAVSFGRDPGAIEWSCLMFACLGSSKEAAWETLSSVVRTAAGRELTDRDEGCYAFGTVDDCVEGIQRYIDIGMTHIVISAKCPTRAGAGDVRGLSLRKCFLGLDSTFTFTGDMLGARTTLRIRLW